MKGISVIICCYNSATRLPDTLTHLANQEVPAHISWEVVVVDNNSTDNTTGVALSEWDKYPHSSAGFKVVKQPVPGLSNARKKGVESAQYDFGIFCDDDNWFDKNFVAIAFEEINKDATIGIIGSYGHKAASANPLPDWFENYSINYAVGPQSSPTPKNKGFIAVYGAGMVFRKNVVKWIWDNYEFYLTDRIGAKLVSGGDFELCFIMQYLGYSVLYNESMRFTHFIPQGRLTTQYLKRMFFGYGYSEAYFDIYKLMLSENTTNTALKYHWGSRLLGTLRRLFLSLVSFLKWKIQKRNNDSLYASFQIRFNYSFFMNLLKKNFGWNSTVKKINMELKSLKEQHNQSKHLLL